MNALSVKLKSFGGSQSIEEKENLMLRKQVFAAVIGGVVGAVLTMAAGSFAPLGAQNEVKDVEFGTITCRSINVKSQGIPAYVIIAPHRIIMQGDEGGVDLRVDLPKGAQIKIDGKDHWYRMRMYVSEHGGVVQVADKNHGRAAQMGINKHGGAISVYGRGDDYARAFMGVNEYGNGTVSTRDKNGDRLADLK